MRFKIFMAALSVSAIVATAASAQTIGIAGTNRGFTSQASAAIAKTVTEKAGLQMRAQTFGGSSIYVPQVSGGRMEFGLANELETHFAVTGTGIYKGRPQPGLRIAARLVPFYVAMFARKGSDIKTIADLKGKRVPAGWTSQKIIGVLMNAELANGGLSYKDVNQVLVSNVVGSANDFAAGKADVFFFVLTAGKVKETAAKVGGLQVVQIDPAPEAMARLRQHVPPAYAAKLEPGPNRPGINETSYLMAYDYLMLTNDKVPADTVYKVLKAMHDNKSALVASFAGMRGFDPALMAREHPSAKFHDGAIRYFRELGQWPPKK